MSGGPGDTLTRPVTGPPRLRLDDLLMHGVRLSVVAALDGVEQAGFGPLRDLVAVSDSVLSKHLAALERAGYVQVDKGRTGRRPVTRVALTGQGWAAYRLHLRAIRDIAAQDVLVLTES